MRSANVLRAVCVGTDEQTSRAALELAAGAAGQDGAERIELYATVGLHPHDARNGVSSIEPLVDALVRHPESLDPSGRFVAVGECGLDYYYDNSPRDAQREVFAAQISLAARHGLALVVHTRDAWEDTLDLLSGEMRPDRMILHCFTGGPVEARRCLDLGAYLSFSGIVTFKNAGEIRKAASLCPSDRLLVETDAPYLAPVPHRGSRNEPAYVSFVGEALAELRGVDAHVIAEATSRNASEAFGLRS